MKKLFLILFLSFSLQASLIDAEKQQFLETNMLRNGGFEAQKSGWTNSGGIFGITTTAAIGKYSATFEASADGQYIQQANIAVPLGIRKNNCSITYISKGGDGNLNLRILDGDSNVILDRVLTGSTDWAFGSDIFTCPNTSTMTVRIISTAAASSMQFDSLFVGDANRVNIANIAQAELYGSLLYDTTASCEWIATGTSNTWDDFSDVAACPTPTTTGKAEYAGSKIPAIKFTNLPAGRYMIVALGAFRHSRTAATASGASFRFSDGTNATASNVLALNSSTGDLASSLGSIYGYLEYTTTQPSVIIKTQSLTSSTTITRSIQANITGRQLQILVYRYPLETELVHRPNTAARASGVTVQLTSNFDHTTTSYTKASAANTKSSYIGNAIDTTTTNDVGFKVPYLPAGDYYVYFKGRFQNTYASTNTTCGWTLSDGTSNTGEVFNFTSSASAYAIANYGGQIISYSSAQYNKEFIIYAKRIGGGGTCSTVGNGSTYPIEIGIIPVGETVNKPIVVEQTYKQYDLTVTGTDWTTVRAVGLPYRTIDGTWRLRFNIQGTMTSGSRSSQTLAIAGVTWNSASTSQTIAGDPVQNIVHRSQANGTSNIRIDHASATTTAYRFSGDVELDSKPTWATGINN